MPPLPVVSGNETVAALQRLGFAVDRQKGSHVQMRRDAPAFGRTTVPLHKELDRGTLRSILRGAGVSLEEFLAALSR